MGLGAAERVQSIQDSRHGNRGQVKDAVWRSYRNQCLKGRRSGLRKRGMRLTSRTADTLSGRRLLYPSSLISAPSVLVIDVPVRHRGVGLPLGRYYPIVLETEAEREEIERFLACSRPTPVPPDLMDHRPSALETDHILISRYDPPASGWPWLSLCRWPTHMADVAKAGGIAMARGCYTMELFDDAEALDAHGLALIESLSAQHEISIRMIAADTLPAAGSA